MDNIQEFLTQFPSEEAEELAKMPTVLWREAEELRLRLGYPAVLISGGQEYTLVGQTEKIVDKQRLHRIIHRFLKDSEYAYPQERSGGFITLPGGHRAGFCGQAVMEGKQISVIRDVTSINIRLARDVPEAGAELWPKLLDSRGRFDHTLIASPPGCGKTTLLRNLIRRLSNGGWQVSVCDERKEISGAGADGFAFDLGRRTDVMTGCPKAQAMELMVRSMGPQVIASDEVGTEAEVRALRRAMASGTKLLTTIHAADLRDVLRGPLGGMVSAGEFFRIVLLTDQPRRGTVAGLWRREAVKGGTP